MEMIDFQITDADIDDLFALVKRGESSFINEPHIGGGNPVVSSEGTSYFNDMLGTTVGTKNGRKYSAAALTAFGERLDNVDSTSPAIRSLGEGWFTGKPQVEGLGRTFLMRNYRASIAKWQTTDPLGYPDGWNQLAYCGNGVTSAVDLWGCEIVVLGEVNWCNFHIATVWANCNHNYKKPVFDITQGVLVEDPRQTIVGLSPNYQYDSELSANGHDFSIAVSFETKPTADKDYDTDPNNLRVRWAYQIKLTITESWEETKVVPDSVDPTKLITITYKRYSTWIERQGAANGVHYIPE